MRCYILAPLWCPSAMWIFKKHISAQPIPGFSQYNTLIPRVTWLTLSTRQTLEEVEVVNKPLTHFLPSAVAWITSVMPENIHNFPPACMLYVGKRGTRSNIECQVQTSRTEIYSAQLLCSMRFRVLRNRILFTYLHTSWYHSEADSLQGTGTGNFQRNSNNCDYTLRYWCHIRWYLRIKNHSIKQPINQWSINK